MKFDALVSELEKTFNVSYNIVQMKGIPEGGEVVKCWAFGRIDKKPPKTVLEVCLVRTPSGRYLRVVTRKAVLEKKK